jgi:hypothetical protein
LSVQKAQRSTRVIDMDKLPPKSAKLDGIEWLPRIIEKARAKLRGEMPPDLMYDCAVTRSFSRRARNSSRRLTCAKSGLRERHQPHRQLRKKLRRRIGLPILPPAVLRDICRAASDSAERFSRLTINNCGSFFCSRLRSFVREDQYQIQEEDLEYQLSVLDGLLSVRVTTLCSLSTRCMVLLRYFVARRRFA